MTDLNAWLALAAGQQPDLRILLQDLSRLLRDRAHVDRLWLGRQSVHPQEWSCGWQWTAQTDECRERRLGHTQRTDNLPLPVAQRGPVAYLIEVNPRLRVDLTGPPSEFELLRQLATEGYTDYLSRRMEMLGRPIGAISWATRRHGGFLPQDVQLLDDLHALLELVVAHRQQIDLTRSVLHTYLGQDVGTRVLQGQIRRGDGVTQRAVLWFCDLRGFTHASGTLERPALLDLLNDWFGEVTAAVHDQHGDVLKFMGDGLLAQFPAQDDAGEACARALRAARDLAGRVAARNQIRLQDARWPVRYGLGLHMGDVMYGNIGGETRLDFTVIGPAVNLAARLESLSGKLGQAVLASRDFAHACGQPLVDLGRHELRGIDQPVEVFGLP